MIIARSIPGSRVPGLSGTFKPGDTVHFTVEKHISSNGWKISINGRRLTVQSTEPLITGKIYKASVRMEKNTLHLRIIQPSLRSPVDTVSGPDIREQIVETAKKNGVLLNTGQLEVLTATLRRAFQSGSLSEKKDEWFTKLLVILAGKGIFLPEENDQIPVLSLLGRHGNREHYNHSGGHGTPRETDMPRESFQKLKQAIKNELKQAARHTSGDSESSFIHLFNHLSSGINNWIVIPFHLDIDGSDVRGAVKLRFSENTRHYDRCTIVAATERGEWEFYIRKKGRAGQYTINVLTPFHENNYILNSKLSVFSKKLRKLGLKMDDTKMRKEFFDGFTQSDQREFETFDRLI